MRIFERFVLALGRGPDHDFGRLSQVKERGAVCGRNPPGDDDPHIRGDGAAAAALTPPPQDFAKALKGKTDDWIAKATREGGPAVGLSPTMPPASDLSDDQIKGLVAYMKQLAGM